MEATLGSYHLGIATGFGPRVTSLRRDGGPEMLAQLESDNVLRHDGGEYVFHGGHRLWAAPESAAVTYASDDHPCQVSESDGVVTVVAPPDGAGLIKEVTLSAEGDSLVVEHRITAHDGVVGSLAPWGITQVPLGGTALLPLVGPSNTRAANRFLVLWAYSSLEDHRVVLRDDVLELEAGPGPELKFGAGPSPGRVGYFRDGLVFLKEAGPPDDGVVPDLGAAGQVYVGRGFCELESLGALTDLSNGGTASLVEKWTVLDCEGLDAATELTTGP